MTVDEILAQGQELAKGAPLDGPANVPPWPDGVLPEAVEEMVDQLSTATQTPRDMAAMMALAVTSTACARRLEVACPGWTEPAHLYVLVVLEPANRKSAVVRELIAPVAAVEEALWREHRAHILAANARRRLLVGDVQQAEKQAREATGKERHARVADLVALEMELNEHGPERGKPQLLLDDVTTERAAMVCAANGERIAVLSAESDLFAVAAGRYERRGRANIGFWLSGHSGDSVRVDRVSREPIVLSQPAITMGITTQESVLRGMADAPDMIGRGLAARMLYAVPPSAIGYREVSPPRLQQGVRERYGEVIREVFQRLTPCTVPPPPPITLVLSDAAERLYTEYRAQIEPRMRAGGDLSGHMLGWAGKLCGQVARIAGLLTALQVAESSGIHEGWPRIDRECMRRAIAIGDYLVEHARRAHAMMLNGAPGPAGRPLACSGDAELAEKIATLIRGHGSWSGQAQALAREIGGGTDARSLGHALRRLPQRLARLGIAYTPPTSSRRVHKFEVSS